MGSSGLVNNFTILSFSDDNSKYGVENSKLDISDILKEQGVRIDDLMALREKLMKGELQSHCIT